MVKPFYEPEPNILNWLQKFVKPYEIVLDVGCGDHRYHDLPCKQILSIDSWPKAEPTWLMDLNESDIPHGEYHIILLLDVLEHLEKMRGLQILEQAKQLAKRSVIVLTPLRWEANMDAYNDPEGFYHGNENVKHRSLWRLSDFNYEWTRVWLPSTQDCFMAFWSRL